MGNSSLDGEILMNTENRKKESVEVDLRKIRQK